MIFCVLLSDYILLSHPFTLKSQGVISAYHKEAELLTCKWCVGEMLRLAALPLAIDDVEVDFDGVADRRVSVGRHFHKQHTLQNRTI